ncbi:hypothetical protein [Nonomuraea sp. NPDC048826]|uniref:hypothetical protein n=1 Tax=Nonomuraea sp. NPDC048826 TaxID=3364347 RepID=UPI0037130448
MSTEGRPFCTWCQAAEEWLTIKDWEPARRRSMSVEHAQGAWPVTRTVDVEAGVTYDCRKCGKSGLVGVGDGYRPPGLEG